MTDCKHGMVVGTCTLCKSSPRRLRGVVSRFESTCRLCRQTIEEGARIAKRNVPNSFPLKSVWAHETCPSYVVTSSERERRGFERLVEVHTGDRATLEIMAYSGLGEGEPPAAWLPPPGDDYR